jgi:hypothetical protein
MNFAWPIHSRYDLAHLTAEFVFADLVRSWSIGDKQKRGRPCLSDCFEYSAGSVWPIEDK